ncbi:ankyrin repeat protein [Luteitalea pratensis]|uniref:Ankyrin repeat protein n=1 Tax=Luteitalea pratensis TaxID=1855912 RepID=A0A143PKL5_LUTPR|nr:ankyrin repeat domain-containing protein [Luteitalea pratensis]AMY08966.1 ankyrin repeat protein [Luteitalea pratensis]
MTLRRVALGTAVLLLLASGRASAADAMLADAAERAAWTEVQTLLTRNVDVNAAQADGMTALHWAAHHDDLDVADALIRAGARVTVSNRYGVTPLSIACTNGNAAMVARFLDAGAEATASLPGGETALMTAARTGSLPTVSLLLSRGAPVDAKDERRGQTALMWAAAEGHAPVVLALLAAGADVHAHLSSGFTPLLFAAREGRLDVVRELVHAGADVNEAIPPDGPGPRRRGYGGSVPPAGTTPLLMAVRNAHFEVAAALLDAGAHPDGDVAGYTALHLLTVVRKPGVGDNDPAPEGSGKVGSLDLVRALVARGANVNARMTKRPNLNNTRLDERGATPFLLAALTADAELMRVLVKAGADPSIPNVDGSTPLMVAAGLATRSPGEDAGTEPEVLEALQLLLDLGADPNAVDRHGETAMHGAAYKNLPKAVRMLAAKGARIDVWNQPDEFGWTPLAISAGYRFGNFKPSPETEAALREVMLAAGVTPPAVIVAKTRQIY